MAGSLHKVTVTQSQKRVEPKADLEWKLEKVAAFLEREREREWMNEWMIQWMNKLLFYEGSGEGLRSFYIQRSPMRETTIN